jgi:hypothetical protein
MNERSTRFGLSEFTRFVLSCELCWNGRPNGQFWGHRDEKSSQNRGISGDGLLEWLEFECKQASNWNQTGNQKPLAATYQFSQLGVDHARGRPLQMGLMTLGAVLAIGNGLTTPATAHVGSDPAALVKDLRRGWAAYFRTGNNRFYVPVSVVVPGIANPVYS